MFVCVLCEHMFCLARVYLWNEKNSAWITTLWHIQNRSPFGVDNYILLRIPMFPMIPIRKFRIFRNIRCMVNSTRWHIEHAGSFIISNLMWSYLKLLVIFHSWGVGLWTSRKYSNGNTEDTRGEPCLDSVARGVVTLCSGKYLSFLGLGTYIRWKI